MQIEDFYQYLADPRQVKDGDTSERSGNKGDFQRTGLAWYEDISRDVSLDISNGALSFHTFTYSDK
jgi:hypothetical protein